MLTWSTKPALCGLHPIWDEPALAARGVMVCLAFQTEVQILKDEEEEALGKET